MENELIKQAFRLGNSAGVLLPREWKGRKVAIKLVEKSIAQEIFEILEERDMLGNTIGVFLAGSYARGEETETSDIDLIVITDNVNKQIKIGKCEIMLISRDKFEKSFSKGNLYLVSLIYEAKAIMNNALLQFYKNKIPKILIKKQINEILSVTKINEGMINIDEELNEKVLDETIYSLVLRLRELYLIGCLKNNKIPSNKEFLGLIKKLASEEAYSAYCRVKNNLKTKKIITTAEAKAIIGEIKRRAKHIKNG